MEFTLLASGPTPATHAGSHDFDFFFGSWRVLNRRLVWPILDGRGNMDEFRAGK